MMKKLVCLGLMLAFLGVEALPQGYGSSGGQSRCRQINVIDYEEKFEIVCDTIYTTKCETVYEQQCRPKREQECATTYEQQCEITQEKQCGTKYRNESYTDKECRDEYVEKCEKHWQRDGYGSKVWVDNPATCHKLKETVCQEVQRSRRVPYEHCDYVPSQQCHKHPVEKCDYVIKQQCQQQPVQDCQKVPQQKCEQQHKKVPVQRRKKVCEGDPEWNTSSTSSNLSDLVLRQGIASNDAVQFGKGK